MTINTQDMIGSILESISRIDYIKPEDIPNINLYMDQVTTFMEEQLASSKRYPEDKILTKTMINNYAKNNLLPSPEKKRYSRSIFFCLFLFIILKISFPLMTSRHFWDLSQKNTSVQIQTWI